MIRKKPCILLMISLILVLIVITIYRKLNSYEEIYPHDTLTTIQNLLKYHGSYKYPKNLNDEIGYNKICPNFGKDIKVVFMVTSSPSHDEARNNIRRTWRSAANRKDLAVAFIIGSFEDENLELKIKMEQLLYNDIIRGKFLDTYSNLTLKTTWILKWVSEYCSKADYTFKTDDDVMVNVNQLLYLIDHHQITPSRSIYGRLLQNLAPIRDPEHKFHVSRAQFPEDTFPDYISGGAYIFPTYLAAELYYEALSLPYVRLEDLFYCGIVANRLGISRIHINDFLRTGVIWHDHILQNSVSIHDMKGDTLYYVWYRINRKKKSGLQSMLQFFKNMLL